MKKERSRKPAEMYEIIEENYIFCLNCGAQSSEEARVCLQCGEDISTLNGTAIPPQNSKRARKGSRKGVIAFAILGVCAFVLVAFAVLTKTLKDRSQKAPELTGGPVVYSGRLPTPTPAPIQTPIWKSESFEIATKALALQPNQLWSQPLRVQNDWRNARLIGKFTAQGGEKNEIEAIVTNEDGLINWQKNSSYQPKAWYRSGPVTEDTINATLPAGQSYFIFDNRLSPPANKTIRFNLRVEYERLAQP
jgi:ribosomal protein L40E